MKIIGFLILLALDVPTVMFRGFVLSRFWHWFVVPLGVREIGIALAIGIAMLVSLVTRNPFAAERDDDEQGPIEKGFSRLIAVNAATLFSWGLGAIVACFL